MYASACPASRATVTNWASTRSSVDVWLLQPTTVAEVIAAVRAAGAGRRVRTATGASPS